MSFPRTPSQGPAVERLGDDILTVACVYKTGRLYSPRYVEILQKMVQRHLSLPHRFVCLSDDPNVPCQRIPLITGWRGFYAKIELFRPQLFKGAVLYFDLDTVIHGNIDELAVQASKQPFGCVSDPAGGHLNSSIQTFTIDCSFIFHQFGDLGLFDRHLRPHLWYAFRRVAWLERSLRVGSSYGDQSFTEVCLKDAGIPITHLDHTLPKTFSTFNFDAYATAKPIGSVCLMMGRPKPHEIETGWVVENWFDSAVQKTA